MSEDTEDWDDLFAFVTRRFTEIGIPEFADGFIAGLEKRFYNNWEMKDCFRGCSKQVTAVLNNLDPDSQLGSEELLDKLIDGEISAYDLAYNGHMDMAPKVWEKDIKEIEARSEVVLEEVWTDEYECESCGKRKQTVTNVQLRSADEGQTLIIKCVCGNKWNIYN